MGLNEHHNIQTISDETSIMKYYPTSKFLSLLESKSLYFSRIDQFDDPFEGYAPVQNLNKEKKNIRELKRNMDSLYNETEFGEFPDYDDPWKKVSRVYKHLRTHSLASCWSIGDEDKLEMWNSYITNGDGVAISSTFGDLRSAIENSNEYDYYAGEVSYIEYFEDFLKTTNYFDFIMTKPNQYRFEKEMRLLIWWPENRDTTVGNEKNPAPEGLSLNVDLDELIQDVYMSPFSPPWSSKEKWNSILSHMDVDATIRRSNLSMEPADYFT